MSDTAPPAPGEPADRPAAGAAHPAARRRPARVKSEQRVQDLLRAAREVFAERGYERTTTAEIAQRLGISEATVFTYFRGKRELCVRVISDWYDEIIAAMEADLPRQAPVREQLAHFVRNHLRLFLIQGTGLCALVLSEGRSRGQELGESFLPLQRRYTAALMDLLARGQAGGEVRADLPLRLLRPLVLGPMEHLLWEVIAHPERSVDLDEVAEQLVHLLWSGLQAPDTEVQALRRLRDDVERAVQRSRRG